MSKRGSGSLREENYEHVLMCLICRSLFDDYDHQPKFLPCHHTFCKDCLREYVKQTGDEIECPSCRKIATIPTAGVVALQTNFYVKYIQSLVYGPSGGDGAALECDIHPHAKLQYYCKECSRSICNKCCDGDGKLECKDHRKVPLPAMTDEYHQKLDTAFGKANGIIEHKKVELEAMMKALCEEKDQAMRKIDSTFEQHVHTLSRRSTLLKNKVIAIYNEHVDILESELEEISTAMTCIISLKEYHENMIGKGYFMDIHKGIAEMDEVFKNIKLKLQPKENHILFEDKHGVEKFKASAKDLGRVRTSRPTLPRTEPEGNDAGMGHNQEDSFSPATPGNNPSDTEPASPSGYDSGFAGGSETQGAVGGAVALESYARLGNSQCLVEEQAAGCDNDDVSSGNKGCHRNGLIGCCDSGGSGVGSGQASNAQLNAHGHSSGSSKLDINSNTPITVPGVVRPKTLSGNPVTSSMSAAISGYPKDGLQHGFSKRGQDKHASQKTGLHASQRSDPGSDKFSLSGLKTATEHARMAMDPDIENLKQTDKMYHHLVYTSYDEEELLKELKCGKVHFDSTRVPPPAPPPAPRGMEDSDSWMTVSSDSTISCASEETPEDQSRL